MSVSEAYIDRSGASGKYSIESLPDPEIAIDDFPVILDDFQISYKPFESYLQVGEITKVQGWILHISVVRWQMVSMLQTILPLLDGFSYRIARARETARSILDGSFGPSLVGKVISIFPSTDEDAVILAKKLIAATRSFKGPDVLTDIHLGGRIYTTYGAFKAVSKQDMAGKDTAYIFDGDGKLTEDIIHIPFILPKNVHWPFASITSPMVEPAKKILKGKYLPLKVLKTDSKGYVAKALYVASPFSLRWCVVKQGKRDMWSDEAGRDMVDRLKWQRDLHNNLADTVNMPAVIDFFEEKGDAYLVLDYVRSESLMDRIYSLNKNCKSWNLWTPNEKEVTLNYLLQVLDIVDKIHQRKYVHRDITPVNFLVNKKDKLVLIDSELAYDLNAASSYLPYVAGTGGFMSPEQVAIQTPTVKEDIYALGALMITVLTGLAPLNFTSSPADHFRKNLQFFLKDEDIVDIIISCLSFNALERPTLGKIMITVKEFKNSQLKDRPARKNDLGTDPINKTTLNEVITKGIRGLVEEPMLLNQGLWLSRSTGGDENAGMQRNEFCRSVGLYEGIAGVLYFLAKASEAGFDISACRKSYMKGLGFIQEAQLEQLPAIAPGLYGGAAGTALTMAKGIKAGLLQDCAENRALIAQSLSLPIQSLDMALGAAGQGMATIACREYLDDNTYYGLLGTFAEHLLDNLDKSGYWVFLKDRFGRPVNAISFSNGNTGIAYFLLEFNRMADNKIVHGVLIKSLRMLIRSARNLVKQTTKTGVRGLLNGNIKIEDGLQGLVLVFLKAYEILQDPIYKEMAKKLLNLYPAEMVHDNVHQDTGLAGIGELHLEAYRILKEPIYLQKSESMARHFIHMARHGKNDTYHWIGNNADFPTADLMVGSAGVLHFLVRMSTTKDIGYRILS